MGSLVGRGRISGVYWGEERLVWMYRNGGEREESSRYSVDGDCRDIMEENLVGESEEIFIWMKTI